jgi:hypothetical protein
VATVSLNVSANGEVADPNALVDAIASAIVGVAPELTGAVNVTLVANLAPEPPADQPAPEAPPA